MRRTEPWYRLVESTLRPPLAMWFNWRFEGLEHIPREGAVLVACNHISYLDPLAHGYMLVKAGRRPRYLAKKELFGNPLLRSVLRGTKQIPVERGSGSAAPIETAREALKEGEVVLVYPEATVTSNPDCSPMRGKTGIARLALTEDVPVLPIAVWGSQNVWQRKGMQSLKFGRPIWLKAGPPLDFSQFEGQRDDSLTLRKVTSRASSSITVSVTLRSVRGSSRWPSNWEKSRGGPAFSQMGRPNFRLCTPLRCHTFCDPHTAIGSTGTSSVSASRAIPVFPRMGERSGLEVTVASG